VAWALSVSALKRADIGFSHSGHHRRVPIILYIMCAREACAAAMHIPPSILIQHLLVIFLVVVVPIVDYYDVPRLKASTDSRVKVQYYWKGMAVSWICAIAAVATVGVRPIFIIRLAPDDVPWLTSIAMVKFIVLGVIVALLGLLFYPAMKAIGDDALRAKTAKALSSMNYLLPLTRRERRWWIPACLTAGICEEVIVRGFMLHYLHVLPFHFTLTLALLLSSLLFGALHLYQGISGGVQTGVIGLVMGILFILTGHLLVPIVVHALLDLRVLLMLPVPAAEAT
jgi:uncharacterized protein